jgi:zinc transporter
MGPVDIGDLVTTFIEGSIVRMSPVMGDLADGIDELEDRILQMDLSGIREQIVSTRRQAIIFNRFLAPQKDIVQRLTEASIYGWMKITFFGCRKLKMTSRDSLKICRP